MLDFKGCENERLEKSLARLMELGPRSDSLAAQRSLYIPQGQRSLDSCRRASWCISTFSYNGSAAGSSTSTGRVDIQGGYYQVGTSQTGIESTERRKNVEQASIIMGLFRSVRRQLLCPETVLQFVS